MDGDSAPAESSTTLGKVLDFFNPATHVAQMKSQWRDANDPRSYAMVAGYGFLFVVSILLIYWFSLVVISNTLWRWSISLPGVYNGPRSGFKGGNYATGGNSPLWYGGSLSDQVNLAADPYYADSTLVGATAWAGARGCPSDGGDVPLTGQALGEATRGQIMQSLPGASSSSGCGASRLSDAALMSLNQ